MRLRPGTHLAQGRRLSLHCDVADRRLGALDQLYYLFAVSRFSRLGFDSNSYFAAMDRVDCCNRYYDVVLLDASSLGKNLTDTVVTRNDAVLVTHGPYRWVRHPFYVCAALLMSSVTMLTTNWLIGISGLLGLTLLAIRTPKEEQMLRQHVDLLLERIVNLNTNE